MTHCFSGFFSLRTVGLALVILVGPVLLAAETPVLFQQEEEGVFSFDTGLYKGVLHAGKTPQGLVSLIDKSRNLELAHAPGIFSFYRLLSANHRWHGDFRDRPVTAALQEDGSVLVQWHPQDEFPVAMRARFAWTNASTLDLTLAFTPTIPMRDVEVFLSSYIHPLFKAAVFADPTFMLPGSPGFLPVDVTSETDLLYGTYLAFPRDQRAAQVIYDGRWEKGQHPVHFAVTRFYHVPMALKAESLEGLGLLFMAKRDDCLAVEMPYNREPDDPISAHSSVYFSLFGEDLPVKQERMAHLRLVLDHAVNNGKAMRHYQRFLEESTTN